MAFRAFLAAHPVGSEDLDQLAPLLGREGADDTDVGKVPRAVVQTEHERPDFFGPGAGRRRRAVPTETADDELGCAFVFDLHHHPFARHVGEVRRLGHHPVEAGTLEAPEPVLGHGPVPRSGRQVDAAGLARPAPITLFQKAPALMERLFSQVAIVECQQVEGNERGGCLFCQQPHPALGRVHPL